MFWHKEKSKLPLALEQSQAYNQTHKLDANQRLHYGFRDGGRAAEFDDQGRMVNNPTREIIIVKHPNEDPALRAAIEGAKALTGIKQSAAEKAVILKDFVNQLTAENNYPTCAQIMDNIAGGGKNARIGSEISLGQLISCKTGVCRHKSLLFKVLADECGVASALVRGNYAAPERLEQHAWNEVVTENGQRLLVDTMLNFVGDMNHPNTQHYQDTNKNRMYQNDGRAAPPVTSSPKSVQPAVTLDDFVNRLVAENRIIPLTTNKGTSAYVTGKSAELEAMQEWCRQKGIETVLEGSDSPIGAAIRVKSSSMARFQEELQGKQGESGRGSNATCFDGSHPPKHSSLQRRRQL